MSYYANNQRIKAVIDRIARGFNGENFSGIANYFVTGNYSVADPYMCLADFESYFTTYHKALDDYKNRAAWTTKAIHNIAVASRRKRPRRPLRARVDSLTHSATISQAPVTLLPTAVFVNTRTISGTLSP